MFMQKITASISRFVHQICNTYISQVIELGAHWDEKATDNIPFNNIYVLILASTNDQYARLSTCCFK